jgi:hypothetical protein
VLTISQSGVAGTIAECISLVLNVQKVLHPKVRASGMYVLLQSGPDNGLDTYLLILKAGF